MKARSERMLCGGKKIWYTFVDIDGTKLYSEHWHGQKGRDAVRKVAAAFNELEAGRELLFQCFDYLIDLPKAEFPEARQLYHKLAKFLHKKSVAMNSRVVL